MCWVLVVVVCTLIWVWESATSGVDWDASSSVVTSDCVEASKVRIGGSVCMVASEVIFEVSSPMVIGASSSVVVVVETSSGTSSADSSEEEWEMSTDASVVTSVGTEGHALFQA